MPRLLAEAGGEAHVMKVAMKPGKPLTAGRLGGAVYLGLPGNPVSAFVTWRLIGARVAAATAGIARHAPLVTVARAAAGETRRPGRVEFRPARFAGGASLATPLAAPAGEALRIELFAPSFSGRVALLCAADGLAVIPAEAERIEEGDMLHFMPF